MKSFRLKSLLLFKFERKTTRRHFHLSAVVIDYEKKRGDKSTKWKSQTSPCYNNIYRKEFPPSNQLSIGKRKKTIFSSVQGFILLIIIEYNFRFFNDMLAKGDMCLCTVLFLGYIGCHYRSCERKKRIQVEKVDVYISVGEKNSVLMYIRFSINSCCS